MDFKKTLTVEVNQKGVSSTANALGKLATKASEVDQPIRQAKGALDNFAKVKLDAVTLEIKGVADQVKAFKTNVDGLSQLASGMKGVSGSFTSVATAAERMVSSTSGLEAFSAKLKEIRDTLQSMQGLSGTLTGISKVPAGVTVRGSGGGGSASDPDKAMATSQKRLINDVQRRSIVATEGEAAWLRYRSAMLGVTNQTEPMIQKLEGANKQLGNVGMSARATAQAMRMVPAQMTDIVTQLAGGQSPFLIMIQQGGQMRDMFQGFGNMFKQVGGMIGRFLMSAAGIATVIGGAIVGVGYAFMKGRGEAEEFAKTLALTGNYAGMTRDSFRDMQASLASSTMTAGQASEAMNALAATGKVTSDVMESVAAPMVKYSKATGVEIEKLAAQYASLAKAPAQAILKLNEGTNFLTASTYEQIVALEKQGNTLEATRIAALALAEGQDQAARAVTMNAGWMDKSWTSVKSLMSDTWDLMKAIGREKSAQQSAEQFAATVAGYRQKYEAMKQNPGGTQLSEEGIRKLQAMEAQVAEKSGVTSAGQGRADFMAKQNAQRQIALQAAVKLEQVEQNNLNKQERMNKALKELRTEWEKLPETSEKKTTEWLSTQEARIREKNKDSSGGLKGSDNTLAALKAQLEALNENTIGLQMVGSGYENVTENAKKLLTVQNLLATGKGSGEQVKSLREQAKILSEIVQVEKINSGLDKQNDEVKKQKDLGASIEVTSQALQDQMEYIKATGSINDTRTKNEKDLAKAKMDANNEYLTVAARNEAALNTISLERIVNDERAVKMKGQAYNAEQQYAKSQIESANTLATLADGQQKELEWMALSNKEREKAQALWKIEVDSRKQIAALEAEKVTLAGNKEALDKKQNEIDLIRRTTQEQIRMVDAFQKSKDSGLSFYGDLSVAAKNWYDALPTQQQEMTSVFSSAYSEMSNVMSNFVTGQKTGWKDMTKSILTNISQMLIKIAVLRTAQMISGVASPNSSTPSSAQVSAFDTYGTSGGVTPSANGNAFVARAFAQGGAFTNSVVNRPTMFAFANGGTPGLGVMGEKPGSVGEAVMPLTRNSKGDLAVSTTGAGSSPQVNIVINVAADGSATSSTSGDSQRDARELARMMEAAALKVITQQQRNGGRLAAA